MSVHLSESEIQIFSQAIMRLRAKSKHPCPQKCPNLELNFPF